MSYNYENAFSLDWNGKIFVMTNRFSDTSGNILYSYDAVHWNSVNPANIDNVNPLSVKWIGQKYILDTSNTLFNSIDGVHWIHSSDVSNTAIYDIETNLEQAHTITFPQNTTLALGQSTTSTIGTFDNSNNSWDFSNNSISVFSTKCNDAVWNGKIWIAVGSGTNSIATSVDGKTWIGRGSDVLSSGNTVRWNRESSIIVAGGIGGIAYSYDGVYWKLNGTFSECISIECNGSLWVASGTSSTNNTIAYSHDGIYWNYASNSVGFTANQIIWNGSFWTIIGNDNSGHNVATSHDGIHWSFSTILNGNSLTNVIYNPLEQNTFFVGSTDTLYETKTNNYSDLKLVATSVSTIIYNGNFYLFGGENTLKYTPDMEYTDLYNESSVISNPTFSIVQFAWNYPNIGSSSILPMTIGMGSGPNTIGYSYDGIQWYGNGSSIFTERGNRVVWNGSLWCAVGSGTNGWVATSLDGILWTPRPNNIMTEGNDIAWNGQYFIAVGKNGDNGKLAISYDGLYWTPIENTFTNITRVAWTGYKWIIYGFGSKNVATSEDGMNWNPIQKTISSFSEKMCPIVTNRYFFLQTSISQFSKYDLHCSHINDISSGVLDYITSVCFDGEKYVAFDVSSNIYVSNASHIFHKSDISSNLTRIHDSTYNGRFIIIGGEDPSGCITYNKTNIGHQTNFHYCFPSGIFSQINGVSSNSGFGFVHTPNVLYLNPNEKLSVITPKYYTNTIIPPTNITMNIYANEH